MNPTIQDLAAELGVHKATVSRAMSGKPGVSDRLRQKILRMATQRGFFPNGQARSLATARTETMALVFCDESSYFLTNPFYSKVLSGIASETVHRSFSLAFCSLSAHNQTAPRNPLPKIIRERRADGLLFVGDQDDQLIHYSHNLNLPLVLVDHRFGEGRYDSVAINNVGGARKAVDYLISLGHRRIGFVGGSLRSPSFSERLDGYRQALLAAGLLDENLIQLGDSHGGYETMSSLLALDNPPTAVFACNDMNAVRAIKAVHEQGLRVPDDISVIGFDDSSCATESWPQLTTIHVDAESMGRLAVQRLIGRIGQEHKSAEQVFMETELVVRQSTALPKGDRRRPHAKRTTRQN